MKLFFSIVGFIALGLAVIGVALPLVPTTPFVLLAAACFLRGSDRMHHWMTHNRLFGRYIRDYEQHKGVTRRVKITAITVMWLWLIISMFIVPTTLLRIVLAVVGLGVSAYLSWGLKTLEK